MRPRQVALPEGPHHQHRHGDGRGHQVAQQLQAGGVHPVQVVEDHDEGRLGGGQGQETGHAFEDQEAIGVGVSAGPGGSIDSRRARPGTRRARAATVGLGELSQQRLVGLVDQLRQGGDPRLVRDTEVLLAVAIEDVGPRGVGAARRLGHQCGLADARFARRSRPPGVGSRRRWSFGCRSGGRVLRRARRRRRGSQPRRSPSERAAGTGHPRLRWPWAGSQTTSTLGTGSGRPFSSRSPTETNSWVAWRPGHRSSPSRWPGSGLRRPWRTGGRLR